MSEAARWASRAAPDRVARREVGAVAARRALAIDGRVALTRPPLVIELSPRPSIAAGEAGRGLGESLRSRLPVTEVVRLSEAPRDAAHLLDGEAGRQLVVAVRDAHRHAWQRAVAEALLERAGDGVLVETGLPSWRPEAAAGFVATHGSGRVNLDAAAALLAHE